ncbi:ribosome small subunit-dependent GTPase A [Bacillus sp. T33-2]|uniref:ribosome small subunit-dependent GTPase A n=1 Tax=Bacillus sp. T33-2 TaxID=2054168 RepID=UPI000C768A80|nr:ribosome small subunit-dependent GTPase A [Bacillus sp. T33-2]PLR98931.1 ribosome small subunit-dependent GTPase A [Bacillus sp. T33-2]
MENGFALGRVALEHKRLYRVWSEYGELLCELSGKLSFGAESRDDLPAVGDWVALKLRKDEQRGTIQAVLPRFSKFSRKTAGNAAEEQIVAANIDTVFIVNSLNDDLNVRRIERYLLLAWESGANPAIILSKADLCANLSECVQAVEAIAFGVPVIPVSVFEETGIEELSSFLVPGNTIALMGSSGVGKSSLINYLAGTDNQKVHGIRKADHKGRHTTTHRELVLLENGTILVDTPGMRELQLWEADGGLAESFSDIEAAAANCRFRDCLHENEPGCAVEQAIKDGEFPEERLDSYKKLLRELAYLDKKLDKKAQSAEKQRWKKVNKQIRQANKNKNR